MKYLAVARHVRFSFVPRRLTLQHNPAIYHWLWFNFALKLPDKAMWGIAARDTVILPRATFERIKLALRVGRDMRHELNEFDPCTLSEPCFFCQVLTDVEKGRD